MGIFILIIALIFLLPFFGMLGWGLKLFEKGIMFLFEGVGNCFGCLLKAGFWFFVIVILLMMCAV